VAGAWTHLTIRLGSSRDVNILLIQLKRIGDLILTAPAIAALREHFSTAEISLVASHGCRELLPAIPGLTRTYVARGKLSDAGDWLSLANSQFDYCFDFSRTDRSAFLTLLSHARNRITFNTVRRSPVRELSYNEFVRSPVRFVHTIDYHLALLTPLGIDAASPKLDLKLPETSRERAAQLLAEQGVGENFVIIHPGSARVEKYWLPKRWAEVIDDCVARRGFTCILTGGQSTIEREHIAEIKSFVREPVIDLSGKLDLLTLTALIERARILLTVDSAPMHLASAVQTAQVVLFGPTNPFHWRPRFAPSAILQGGVDGPMTDFSPERRPVPMKEISTGQVINAMESLLSATAATAL